MAQDETTETSVAGGTQESPVIYVAVPADKAQAVANLVERLKQEDEDVNGFMLSLGLFAGTAVSSLTEHVPTYTHCFNTAGGNDVQCENDTLIYETTTHA